MCVRVPVLYHALEMQIGQKMSMDVINQLAAPEMVESYLKSSREEIELIVRRTVACEELFKLENIEVTEEEFKAEVLVGAALGIRVEG